MTTSKLLFPAGIKILSTYLAHVGDPNVDPNHDDITIHPAGEGLPVFTGSKHHSPEVSIDCTELANALDLMDTPGNNTDYLYADLSSGNVDVYYRGAQSMGMNEDVTDATKHVVYRLQENALLVWDSISGGQDDDGLRISLKLYVLDNASQDPIQIPAVAVNAAGTIVAPFTMGPIQVNGTAITGIKSFNWQNNYEVIQESSDGDDAPTFLCIRRVRPVLTFDTTDLKTLAGYSVDGTAVTALNVYLRKRRPNKRNYADADLEHIKLSCAVGGAPPSGDAVGTMKWTGTSGNPGIGKVAVHLQMSQSGARMLTYAKDQAIT